MYVCIHNQLLHVHMCIHNELLHRYNAYTCTSVYIHPYSYKYICMCLPYVQKCVFCKLLDAVYVYTYVCIVSAAVLRTSHLCCGLRTCISICMRDAYVQYMDIYYI
jgi:hypothetical protein